MKLDHRGFVVHQARKLQGMKRLHEPEAEESGELHPESLRNQIAHLRKENILLRKKAKLSLEEKIRMLEEQPSETARSMQDAADSATQEAKNEKLTQVNAQLIITGVELQVAMDKIENAKAEMTHLAHYDFLTDLPNRMQLYDRINLAIDWAKRHHAKMALLFLDIDRFKQINDSLGHMVGDKLLQSIAHRLKSVVRSTDTVSRLGGDEFVLLLSEFDQVKTLIPKIEKIRELLAEPHNIEGHKIDISTSIGISLYPEDGEDSDTLMLNADSAMYHAKENGRNRFYFFKPVMRKQISNRQNVEKGIYSALKKQEFELFYQAQINLEDGTIAGVEALIRWRHPVEGVLPPAYFIPAAEECGAIIPIGRWVLHEACRQAQAWLDEGLDFHVMAVNISVREFDDHEFLENICTVLQETGLAPSRLELEITETVLMKNIAASAQILHTLRSMGIKISIDDFGTGYSSLSYLKRIPIDTLKIDQSFVSDISAVNDDVLVKAIIAIGKNLHHKVIAEGVETVEQLDFLRSNDCEAAQGYYLHAPMTGREFTSILQVGIRPDRLH
jgi:diguanylate cyclase (GGDEF)-like protein